jgi:2-polyprenyl-6-methoxyphenol hydroxylase-like FAD-dependent oxidoreductase
MADEMADESISTKCCVVGGGPAGMMLGFLLARAGVDVVVLEKHADFLRDFRGDTVHPSTLELMHELGLLDEFLKQPHQKIERLSAQIGEERIEMADFTHLPTHCKFVALMPQRDFLNFLASEGKRYPTFDLRMKAEAADLIEENGRVAGVRARTPAGGLTIRADLVVGCDGRHSRVREAAGFKSEDYGAPMDVLWFRLSRHPSDSADTFGHVEAGKMMVMLDRGDYWQCAYVIPKGGIERVKTKGLEAFRGAVVQMSPFLADRVGELKSWDDIKLLSVTVDRLQKWWRPGLICIGDAAHAMSPIGGVGINIAVQDAVAAANRLAAQSRHGDGRRSAGDPGSAHLAGAIYPVAAAHRAEAGRQPRAGRNGAAEAAAVVPADWDVSDPAPLAGAFARGRHPARASAYAGCLRRTGIARGAPRRVNPGCFSSFAIRLPSGRGFRRGVIPRRDRCRAACAPPRADDRR